MMCNDTALLQPLGQRQELRFPLTRSPEDKWLGHAWTFRTPVYVGPNRGVSNLSEEWDNGVLSCSPWISPIQFTHGLRRPNWA